jgi:hypothetical protein
MSYTLPATRSARLTATCLDGQLHPIPHDLDLKENSTRVPLAVAVVLLLRRENHLSSNGQNRRKMTLHDVGVLLMSSLTKEVA